MIMTTLAKYAMEMKILNKKNFHVSRRNFLVPKMMTCQSIIATSGLPVGHWVCMSVHAYDGLWFMSLKCGSRMETVLSIPHH